MTFEESELIKKLESADRTKSGVESLASRFAKVPASQYGLILKTLMHSANDIAIGMLLLVAAVNKIKLDPLLLARSLKTVYNVIDFCYPYRYQEEEAIEPLLEVAQAEDISDERKALAGNLAAELIRKFAGDTAPVKKVLLKLKQQMSTMHTILIVEQSLELLSMPEDELKKTRLIIEQDALNQLPKRQVKTVVSGSYTVKRPVRKIGRNQPCHCGSGKKYKKCCYEKDQLLLEDASAHEGLTKAQLKESPELVEDSEIIDEMRAYELQKINLEKLGKDHLIRFYRRAESFKRHQLAFDALKELDKRFDKDEFDRGHFEDLLHETLESGNTELAKEIETYLPDHQFINSESIRFKFDLLENKDKFADLEERCRIGITGEEKKELFYDNPLVSSAFDFENLYPALSIVFARSAIINNPDDFFTNKVLLDALRNARINLDLDPESDPLEELLDSYIIKSNQDHFDAEKAKEFEALQDKIASTSKQASSLLLELRKREKELSELSEELEKHKQDKSSSTAQDIESSPIQKPDAQVSRLKQKIENLKIEIQSQQDERHKLRNEFRVKENQYQKELRDLQNKSGTPHSSQTSDNAETPQTVLIPEYSETFRKKCESLPNRVVEKALKEITGFAVLEPTTMKKVRQIESKSDLYRIRIGMDFRLMISWNKNVRVCALDIIKRADLETWLKQHT